MFAIDETTLARIEETYAAGLTSAEILDVLAQHGVSLSEATLRKYVQLGLLPRSVRVGRKGKHQGSQGIYPVQVIRVVLRIKRMMAESYTIEQIQRDFLFMSRDLADLEQSLVSVFKKVERVLRDRHGEPITQGLPREVRDAKAIGKDLMARLGRIEHRLTTPTRLQSVIAS